MGRGLSLCNKKINDCSVNSGVEGMAELVDICLSCGLWFCLGCIGQVSRVFKSWLLMDRFLSLFTRLFHNYMELCSLWAWWMLLPSWDSPACSSGMALRSGWECLSNELGLQSKQNVEVCVSRELFWLSRRAGYKWGEEKKHGLEGAWAELQSWVLQRDASKCWSLWAVNLQYDSQLMRSAPWNQGWTCVFLYMPPPEPSLPGLALFILSTSDLSASYNCLWEKHGASFHNRRTGGSEYWEKGSLLHDFAYRLLA